VEVETMQKLLTAKQLANVWGLRETTIKTWARTGHIPCVRLSARVIRFDLDAATKALSDKAETMEPERHRLAVSMAAKKGANQ